VNDTEFRTWQLAFQKAMGLDFHEAAFVDGWFRSLSTFDVGDAIAALRTLPADQRLAKTLPRDRLGIVKEHVMAVVEERKRADERRARRWVSEEPPALLPEFRAFLDQFKVKKRTVKK
jgi:hypothetical protein